MTILRSGASKKYSDNWTKAFGGKKSKASAKKASMRKASSKPAKKSKSKK